MRRHPSLLNPGNVNLSHARAPDTTPPGPTASVGPDGTRAASPPTRRITWLTSGDPDTHDPPG